MADDIVQEEFENGASTQQANRLAPGEEGSMTGGNPNADLREKGDADDVAEAVIQGDAETATREVGLRSDSPTDLTREDIEENGRQQIAEPEETEVVATESDRVVEEAPTPGTQSGGGSVERRTTSTRTTRTEQEGAEAEGEVPPAAPDQSFFDNNGQAISPDAAAPVQATEGVTEAPVSETADTTDTPPPAPNGPANGGGPGGNNGGNAGNNGNGGNAGNNGNGGNNGNYAPAAPAIEVPSANQSAIGQVIDGGNGKDTLVGGDGDDILNGGNGKDILDGGAGNDTLTGGNGNDTFVFGENFGSDVITDFKPGNDQIDLSALGIPDFSALLSNAVMDGTDTVITTDQGTITLSNVSLGDLSPSDFGFDDTVTTPPPTGDDGTGTGSDTGDDGTGTDPNAPPVDTSPDDTATDPVVDPVPDPIVDQVINGGNGKDVLTGGDGNDIIDGGNGKDVLNGGGGDDTLTGGNGNDTFVFEGDFGDDVITDFKPGNDQIDLSAIGIPDLATLLENAVSSGNDTIITTDQGTITLSGVDPSDLSAGDFVFGDTADGGILDTVIDTVSDVLGTAGDTAGDTPPTGGDTGDVAAQPEETDPGAATADTPVVDTAADPIVDQVIGGGNGQDALDGGAGNDVLDGGNGKDVLEGGAGDDTLTGGNGNDTFAFEENFGDDVITDFKPGNDQIDLSSLGIPDLSTLMDNAVSDNGDTVITTDHGTITLSGVDPADLSADDFVFGDTPAIDTPVSGDDSPATGGDAPVTGDDAPVTGDDAPGNSGNAGNNGNGQGAENGGDNPGIDLPIDLPIDIPSIDTSPVNQIIDGGNGKDELGGGDGDDVLDGGNGKDVLEGGAGDDTLTGGNGNDTFAFEQNFGDDVITDFKPGNDQIDLSSLGIPDFNTLLSNATMNGGDTVITTDEGTITLSDVSLGDLSASDFAFGDAPVGGDAPVTGGDTPDIPVQTEDTPATDTPATGGDAPGNSGNAGNNGDNGNAGNNGNAATGDVAAQPVDTPVVDTPATGGDAPGNSGNAGNTGNVNGQGNSGNNGNGAANAGSNDDAPGNSGNAGNNGNGNAGDGANNGNGGNNGNGAGSETAGGDGGAAPASDPVADTLANPEIETPAPVLEGDSGDNMMGGTDGADIVDAGSGNDTVRGGGGDDIVDGGTGNDRLEGGDGADVLTGGEGTDTLYGGDGGDILGGGEGADYLNSGKGDDVISGGTGDDRAYGGDGNDIVDGGEGDDRVYGNSGDDTVSAGSGDDRAYGGDGNDTVSGGDGNDRVHGNDGNDTLDGGAGNDRLHGGSGEDVMSGGEGTDRLSGGHGGDVMDGGAGNDRLYGGSGDDTIDGGAGDDYLKGDSGADTFVFQDEFGDDSIRDFDTREGDSIDLSGTEIGDFRSLMDNSYQDGNNTVIDLDGGSITLRNVDRNELSADEFAFADVQAAPVEPGSAHEIPDLPAFDSLNPGEDGANGVHPDAVTVSSAQTVTMTFEGETAGYQSSVGHYTVNADGVIENVEMAWENASLDGSGGDLVGGESQVSFDVDAGSRVGVFLVPNGNRQNDFEDFGEGQFEFRDENGEPATINTPSPTLVFVQEDGNEITIDSQSGEIFHSAGKEMHSDDMEHSFSGTDADGNLMIGFEDLLGGGDHSFDDLVVKMEFEPAMDEAGAAEGANGLGDESGIVGGADIDAVGFDFVAEGAGAEESVFDLDFTDLIPEGADEGQFEVRVSGLPSQVSASKGDVDSDRNWTLTMMQVVGLTIAVPTAASAADLMEDVTFQVVDTQTGDVVAEGLLDGEALDAGETTISILPQIEEEAHGNNVGTRDNAEEDEKAEETEAEAGSEEITPIADEAVQQQGVQHVAAPAAAPVIEEAVSPIEPVTEEIEAAIEETLSTVFGNRAPAEVNEAPTDLTLATSTIAENAANGAVVGTVEATDANSGDTFTYSLTDDSNGRFAIDPGTGVVTVADRSQIDFETTTSHDITVQVTDSAGATYDEVMTINIADSNDTPTDMSITASSVAENAANGTVVGTVSATDPDAGETFTYALTDNAGGRFAIDANTGVVTVADGSLLDFETATSHNVTVRVTDSGGNTYDEVMPVTVNNANEAATDMSITASTVAENAANGTAVGTVSTTDVDAGDTHTYSLVNDQGGRFAIDPNTGVVTVADSSKLDYETKSSFDLEIRVTDAGGLTYDETMTVNLTDANETPTDLKLTGVEIAEGAANGTSVGTVAATDADAGETFTYSLTNDAGGRFAIDVNTGAITVADGSLLDYETATSHDLTVRVTDSGGNTYDETYTIGVNDERESPDTMHAEVMSYDPVAYFRLDGAADGLTNANGYGHTATDETGNHTLTYNGGTDPATGPYNNISTGATEFDGSNEYAVIPDDPAWQLTSGSVQVLFNLDDSDADGLASDEGAQALLSRDASGDAEPGHFKIYTDGDDLVVRIQGTNGGTLTAAHVISAETWHQVNVNFGSGGLEIWMDGTMVAHDPSITQGIDGNNEPWVVGASSSSSTLGGSLDNLGGFFDGEIAEVAIFDSQLDSAAINDIYNAGVDGHDSSAPGSQTADHDMIQGTAGNDTIAGNDGDDFLYGGDGDDTLDGGSHDDVISGGAGTDTVDYSGFGSGVTVNLETGTATDGGGGTDTLSGIENVIGTNAADTITGDDADNVLTGNNGNDILHGQDGDDTIYGGIGADTITGGAGDDLIQGGSGNDNMDGGAGTDTVTYAGAANGVNVNLAAGTATDGNGDTDTLTAIENIIGTSHDDTIRGSDLTNELTGGDGNDRFILGEGGSGMDTIHGGAGGGWTDTLQLLNTDNSSVATGWTVQLTTGSVQSDDGSTMTLTDDAAGTITLDDGSQIAFDGLEKIEY